MVREFWTSVVAMVVWSTLFFDYAFPYKAAVYEHAVIFPADRTRVVNRTEALEIMKKNIFVYFEQCEQASKEGAQIIVFPEYGLYGIGWSRQTIAPYLEYIPDPENMSWNPCSKPFLFTNTDVQQALSCMARKNNIHVVANMGAAEPCGISDPNCPDDGKYQYSANVVYDSNGKFIARYFKRNLYHHETFYFNEPNKVDYTVFNTSFGLFGTFSSYDVMFHEPSITLIEKMEIKNIISPTAWKDELPLMAAVEFHSAFSMGLGIKDLI